MFINGRMIRNDLWCASAKRRSNSSLKRASQWRQNPAGPFDTTMNTVETAVHRQSWNPGLSGEEVLDNSLKR